MTLGAAATLVTEIVSRPIGRPERVVRSVPKGVDAHAFDRDQPDVTLCGLPVAELEILTVDFASLGPFRQCDECRPKAGMSEPPDVPADQA